MWDHHPAEWDEDQKHEFRSFVAYTQTMDEGAWLLLEEYVKNLLSEEAFYAMQWAVYGDGQSSLD